jgi:two-component system invasion response regulator UvrY
MQVVDVLIVDDQAPFRSAARALVRLLPGWRVIGEAESGEAAYDGALEHRPAIILMDINLPGINGMEATRRILAELPKVNIVLVSTYAADDLPPEADTCGAIAYIRKDDLTPARLRALPINVGAGPDGQR